MYASKNITTVICQEANKNGILTVLTLDFEPEFSDMRIEVEEPNMPPPLFTVSALYLDSGIGHVGGGAARGRVRGPDGDQQVHAGQRGRAHAVGGPARQAAEVHLRLGRVADHAPRPRHRHVRVLPWRNNTI